MAALVQWQQVGPPTKTGTDQAALYADMNTMFVSKAADDNFPWEVASYNDAATPYYLVLKRKNASVGRILFVSWTSAPAGVNSVLFPTGSPNTSGVYCTYFPNGNVDTPSNLTSASGTVMGNDTAALYCTHYTTITNFYGSTTEIQSFVHGDGVLLFAQDPAASTQYLQGAGELVVDAADVAYPACMSTGNSGYTDFALTFPYSSGTDSATASWSVVKSNYGAANSIYYFPFKPTSSWLSGTLNDGTNMGHDSESPAMWYYSMPLIEASTPGAAMVLKLRQMACGPVLPYAGVNRTIYEDSAILPEVIQPDLFDGNSTPHPWLTNFKV